MIVKKLVVFTIEDVDHDCCPRRLCNGTGIVSGVSLTGVGDVESADGTVRQQVRFDTAQMEQKPKIDVSYQDYTLQ